jgi:ADP-heptose:LPS heptosyltransferase
MRSVADIPPVPFRFPAASRNDETRRIGFCWWAEENGVLRQIRRLDQYTARSVADDLRPLGEVYSLVPPNAGLYGKTKPWRPRYAIQPNAELADWKATTRFIQTLDYVVTVDTAVAHLAGILNIPTLMLLPLRSDWKWGIGTYHGEWYGHNLRYYRSPTVAWQPEQIGKMAEQVLGQMAERCGATG